MQLSAHSKRPNPLDQTNSHSHAASHACALPRPVGYEERKGGQEKSADGGGWMRLEGRGASRVGMLSPPDARTEGLRPWCTCWSRDFNRRQEPAGPFWGKTQMGTWRVSTRTRSEFRRRHAFYTNVAINNYADNIVLLSSLLLLPKFKLKCEYRHHVEGKLQQ